MRSFGGPHVLRPKLPDYAEKVADAFLDAGWLLQEVNAELRIGGEMMKAAEELSRDDLLNMIEVCESAAAVCRRILAIRDGDL